VTLFITVVAALVTLFGPLIWVGYLPTPAPPRQLAQLSTEAPARLFELPPLFSANCCAASGRCNAVLQFAAVYLASHAMLVGYWLASRALRNMRTPGFVDNEPLLFTPNMPTLVAAAFALASLAFSTFSWLVSWSDLLEPRRVWACAHIGRVIPPLDSKH
jgi:hypothetical protein